ncbi:hypothetical protein AWZ03_009032 [Drosophila navojoa]|uniref:Uncharacterized protein n=1 Tax=Drosophila navojoa TaxID=7232 RepID=A0A484B947_DRONA|nr:hypothetical protein AWZ03_009032 [Drosophila navojoa]
MHVLVITPNGKTVKVDVGDDVDPADMNLEGIVPLDEANDKYPTTSEKAQIHRQLDFIDKLTELESSETKQFCKKS